MKARKQFSKEFKAVAVKLAKERGVSVMQGVETWICTRTF